MKRILNGSTNARDDLEFYMVDSADHISGKTGLTPTVTIRKPGGSFASPSGAVSEIANGWYRVAANATDNNTNGALLLHATATGADPSDTSFLVVAHDNVNAASPAVTADAAALRSAVGLASANLDTQLSGIQADTDNLQTRIPAALTANGNLKVSVLEFLTTALTEAVGGQVTGGFKKWFDVAAPVGTVNSIPNATAGASGGLAIVGSAMTLAPNSVDAAALAADAGVEIGTAVWASTTRVLTGSQGIKKNTALAAFPFRMTDSTNHAPATGLTITAQRSLDGGAFGACANTVVAIGSGWYKIDLAASDLNANTVALKFTATGADQCDVAIVTSP